MREHDKVKSKRKEEEYGTHKVHRRIQGENRAEGFAGRAGVGGDFRRKQSESKHGSKMEKNSANRSCVWQKNKKRCGCDLKCLVIIPAYNEEDSIFSVIRDIEDYCTEENIRYLVINDCSTDRTKEILKEYNISYLDLPINLGIGGGVQTGYQYALENGYDIAVQFDGDGQHMATYIKNLIAPIEAGEADIVIGSRFLIKEGFQSSVLRRFGIRFLSGVINVLCSIRVKDVTSGMRAVNRRMIKEFSRNYAQDYPEPESILFAGLLGARIIEVPVQMRERQGGRSSINAFRSVYYMIKVSLSLIIMRLTNRRR